MSKFDKNIVSWWSSWRCDFNHYKNKKTSVITKVSNGLWVNVKTVLSSRNPFDMIDGLIVI